MSKIILNTPVLLNDADAVELLIRLAEARGLYASRVEAQQTWKTVTGRSVEQRLAAAWAWMFPGHTIENIVEPLASNAQLPAWLVQDGCIGIVRQLNREGRALKVEWFGRAPDGGKARHGQPEVDDKTPDTPAALGHDGDGKVAAPAPKADPSQEARVLVPVPPVLGAEESIVPKKRRGPASEAIIAGLKAHKGIFVQVGIATVLMNTLAIATALFAMQVYDRVIPNFAYATLWVLASGVALAALFELLFKIVRLRLLESSAVRLDEALSLYFFEKLVGLKPDRRPNRQGSLVAQFRDYESVKQFFTSSTLFVLADLPFIIFFIVIIGTIGGPIAAVLTVFVFLAIFVGLVVYRPIARIQREDADESARRMGILFETIAGSESVKSQGAESRFSDVWLRSTRAAVKTGSRLRIYQQGASFATQGFSTLAYAAIIVSGVYIIESGELTMGGLIACSILAGRVLANVAQITQLLLQWHNARYSLEILNKVLACPSDDAPDRQASARAAPRDFHLLNLKYGYEGAQSAQLEIPEVTIPQGERLAVIGRNGSGKSTLLKLLAAVHTPSQGEVRFAGIDMQAARVGWLRDTIGYLPQDVRLFNGTLGENLTMGISRPEEENILNAMQLTGLDQTLGKHPLGLNLPIREGGVGLSGGQRQLVGLTRLLLQKPKVWLLDEPSASLDQYSEERLIKLLAGLPADNTVIFTSHRQSWLALAQRVFFMEDGKIKLDSPADRIRTIQQRVASEGNVAAKSAVEGPADAGGLTHEGGR